MSKSLELVRILGCHDRAQLETYANYVSAATDGWFSEAAELVGTKPHTGKPLVRQPYVDERGFGYDIWLHGSEQRVVAYGQLDRFLERTDLTDTERETIALQTRKEIAAGNQVFSIAHLVRPATTPATLNSTDRLALDGSLVVRYARPNRVQ